MTGRTLWANAFQQAAVLQEVGGGAIPTLHGEKRPRGAREGEPILPHASAGLSLSWSFWNVWNIPWPGGRTGHGGHSSRHW